MGVADVEGTLQYGGSNLPFRINKEGSVPGPTRLDRLSRRARPTRRIDSRLQIAGFGRRLGDVTTVPVTQIDRENVAILHEAPRVITFELESGNFESGPDPGARMAGRRIARKDSKPLHARCTGADPLLRPSDGPKSGDGEVLAVGDD